MGHIAGKPSLRGQPRCPPKMDSGSLEELRRELGERAGKSVPGRENRL